jgi:hypothetical protein
LTPETARHVLTRLFRQRRIADLPAVFAALRTTSVMTAHRRLSELAYLSSYSHAGRFYTLPDIATFDADGLWMHEGVGFSRCGTLKDTVPALVDRAEAGLFHRDLQARLQVRVHNTLLELVQARRLGREVVAGDYLYVSADAPRAQAQLAQRHSLATTESIAPVAPGAAVVIEILIEVIRVAGVRGDAKAVAARLSARGLVVTVEQVQQVFIQHGLPEKKRFASRST